MANVLVKVVLLNDLTDAIVLQNDNFNGQWKQLHKMGERMCCSQNWIRNFNTEIGGGHAWTVDKNQLILVKTLKLSIGLEKADSNFPTQSLRVRVLP